MTNNFTINHITSKDYEDYANLSSKTFGVSFDGELEILNSKHVADDQILVGKINEELVSQLFIHNIGVWLNGKLFSAGGIGGMITDNKYRGKGFATKLLNESLKLLNNTNYDFSILFSSKQGFNMYSNLGWVVADTTVTYEGIGSSFSTTKECDLAFNNKKLSSSDLETLKMIRNHNNTDHGLIKRNSLGWEIRILGKYYSSKQRNVITVSNQNTPCAYLVYGLDEDDKLTIYDFVYNNETVLCGLLNSISRIFPNKKVLLKDSEKSKILSLVKNKLKISIVSSFENKAMYRIVNFERIMNERSVDIENNGSFIIDVKDHNANWNNGLWNILITDNKVNCKRTTSAPADITLDISVLTELLTNYIFFEDLLIKGLLKLNNPEKKEIIKSFFGDIKYPYANDSF